MNAKISIIAGLAVCQTAGAAAREEVAARDGAQKTRPNIIFILADDLGYGDLGCYGQRKIETPNIDGLAREGMRFTQFYAGCSLSAPSRCVLLTGMHTGHAAIRFNDELPGRGNVWSHEEMYRNPELEGQYALPAGTVTFPQLLQKEGYTTACVGKWGLGNPLSEGAPDKMGFDFFYGYNCQRLAHTYYPPALWRNGEREFIPNRIYQPGEFAVPDGVDPQNKCYYDNFNTGVYSPDLMYDEIVAFVEANREKPFMLAWTTTIPHMALQAPQRLIDYYHGKFGDEEPYRGDNGYYPSLWPRATYAAMVGALDEQVGGLVEKLRELGIYDNTLIVFSSDNGAANHGGPDPVWFESGGPFRADKGWGKTTLREGGIRVPLIASWPGVIEAGAESGHICAGWDMFATFCDAAGVAATPTDGISFLPEMAGQRQKEHQYLYWEYPGEKGIVAVRYGKWKGLLHRVKEGNTHIELFDLEADPRETTDLSAEYPRIVQKIRRFMEEAHTDAENPMFQL